MIKIEPSLLRNLRDPISKRILTDCVAGSRRIGDTVDAEIHWTDIDEDVVPWLREKEDMVSFMLTLNGIRRCLQLRVPLSRTALECPRFGWFLAFLEAESREHSYARMAPALLREHRASHDFPLVEVADTIGVTANDLSRWEGGDTRDLNGDHLYRWMHALGLVLQEQMALVRVATVPPDLMRWLQDDPHRLTQLSPHQFEQFVAERLDNMGFHVSLNGRTNQRDGGIDLVAVPKVAGLGSFVLAGQVKHHQDGNKSGRADVDRLLAHSNRFTFGMLVTNTSFTRDAVWAAQSSANAAFLKLRDFADLKRWLQGQYGSPEEWREIPDEIEVAPGLKIKIPKPRFEL